ncbi:MAG: 2-C-methyl-D-erythritol 4-phosphate cytidylyltransferase [Planctomycetota bacterium]
MPSSPPSSPAPTDGTAHESARPPLRAAAVLLAAGASSRMGGERSKALIELGGRAVVARAAASLVAAQHVEELVVVVREDGRADVERALGPLAARVDAWAVGGAERTDSVRAGVAAVSDSVDVVLVHDAARCFVAPDDVAAVARAAADHGAALLASRVRDTLKHSSNGFQSDETVDRDRLWAAETPQGMRIARFRDVLARAAMDGFRPTDDAALHEHYHGPTKLVESTRWNVKLTTPKDLEFGEALARALDAEDATR